MQGSLQLNAAQKTTRTLLHRACAIDSIARLVSERRLGDKEPHTGTTGSVRPELEAPRHMRSILWVYIPVEAASFQHQGKEAA